MKVVVLVSLGLLLCTARSKGNVAVHNEFYCFADDAIRPQGSLFATQSEYEDSRGRTIDQTVSTCTPSKFWIVARHGGRNPPTADITFMREFVSDALVDTIIRNYERGMTSLCYSDAQNLRAYRLNPNMSLTTESLLTVPGWDLMKGIASRYQAAFPTLLPTTYNSPHYRFRHAFSQRSQGSLRAFADGLFGGNNFERVAFDDVPDRDILLRSTTFCPAYTAISTDRSEQMAFEEGPEFRQMLNQVNAKLGFTGSERLTRDQVIAIWEWCRVEFYSEVQPALCAAFSIANLQVIDYHEDLFTHRSQGYGLPNQRLAQNLNCALVQDLLQYLTSDTTDRARIYGIHSMPIRLLLVTLGVFEDAQPLTRHNFAQNILRQWRTGVITPKGTNLAAIRYDCPTGEGNEVQFLWNEIPLQLPGCQANGLCKVDMVVQRYQRFLNANCEDLFCSSN